MCISYLALNFCSVIWYAFIFLVYQVALTPSTFPTYSKTVNTLGLGEEQKSNRSPKQQKEILELN